MAAIVGVLLIGLVAWLLSDQQHSERSLANTHTWSGYKWDVRSGTGTPGPCKWNPNSVTVDAHEHLHMRITKAGDEWSCSEIHSRAATGYGTYTFNVRSDLRGLDPSVVFGLFTYDRMGRHVGNSEVDIEAAKWGIANDPNAIEYSIQPTTIHQGKRVPLGSPPYVAKFVWARDHVDFSVTDSSGNAHSFVGTIHSLAPPAKTTQASINLWLFHGKAPKQPVEIVLSSFNYIPLADYQ